MSVLIEYEGYGPGGEPVRGKASRRRVVVAIRREFRFAPLRLWVEGSPEFYWGFDIDDRPPASALESFGTWIDWLEARDAARADEEMESMMAVSEPASIFWKGVWYDLHATVSATGLHLRRLPLDFLGLPARRVTIRPEELEGVALRGIFRKRLEFRVKERAPILVARFSDYGAAIEILEAVAPWLFES